MRPKRCVCWTRSRLFGHVRLIVPCPNDLAHPWCLEIEDRKLIAKMHSYAWECTDCKECQICGIHDDFALYCDVCDRAEHKRGPDAIGQTVGDEGEGASVLQCSCKELKARVRICASR